MVVNIYNLIFHDSIHIGKLVMTTDNLEQCLSDQYNALSPPTLYFAKGCGFFNHCTTKIRHINLRNTRRIASWVPCVSRTSTNRVQADDARRATKFAIT